MLLMTLLHFCCICLTGLFLKATFLTHKTSSCLSNSQETYPRSRPLPELPPHLQPFLPFQDTCWLPYNLFLILSSQDFCLLDSRNLGLITQLKRSFSPFCLTSTLLSIDPNLRCWLYIMFQPLLTW